MSLKEDFIAVLDSDRDLCETFTNYVDDIWGEQNSLINIGGFIVQGVDQHGGEGMGESYWVVFSVERDMQKEFFKLDGWYASYNGHEFDNYLDFNEVKQVEKVVKVWE